MNKDIQIERIDFQYPKQPMTVDNNFKLKVGCWITTDFWLEEKSDSYKYSRVYSIHKTRQEANAKSLKDHTTLVGPITKEYLKKFKVIDNKLWYRALDKYNNLTS